MPYKDEILTKEGNHVASLVHTRRHMQDNKVGILYDRDLDEDTIIQDVVQQIPNEAQNALWHNRLRKRW